MNRYSTGSYDNLDFEGEYYFPIDCRGLTKISCFNLNCAMQVPCNLGREVIFETDRIQGAKEMIADLRERLNDWQDRYTYWALLEHGKLVGIAAHEGSATTVVYTLWDTDRIEIGSKET